MDADKVHQRITILFAASVGASLMYAAIAFFLSRTGFHPLLQQESVLRLILFTILLLVSMATLVFVVRGKQSLFGQNPEIQIEKMRDFQSFVISRCVIWFALSEIPAVLGLAFFFLYGNLPATLLLVFLSIISFVAAKPGLPALQNLETTLGA